MAESMSKKMYANSPKIVADADGKKKVAKGPTEAEKKSARTSDGTEGIPINERQFKEIDDMYSRHAAEHKDIVSRHMKELKSASPANPAAGAANAEDQGE